MMCNRCGKLNMPSEAVQGICDSCRLDLAVHYLENEEEEMIQEWIDKNALERLAKMLWR